MTIDAVGVVTSTVSALTDDALLAQTRKFAHLEHHVEVTVIDHLHEIHARRLHLRRGFSSLFDYTVRELGYSDSAASRRISAMKLCEELPEVRDGLQDGSISLTTAAQLQNAFDRQKRNRRRRQRGAVVASRPPVPPQDSLLSPAAEAPEPPEPALVLDVSARRALVQQAAGRSTRQVQELLAGVDPELTVSADKVRPLGDGRYELKAVIDAECHRALERLRGLLSHVDPYMTLGQLVGRLAREGLDRHDPTRPPRRPRTGNGPAGGVRTSAPKKAATPRGAVTGAEQAPAQPATQKSAPAASPNSPDGSATSAAKSQQGLGREAGSARKRVARPDSAATSAPKRSASAGRAIPAATKREVWQRDGGRCSYVDPRSGRRCASRHLLQIDHLVPYALGGSAAPANLRLCLAHHRHRHQGCSSPAEAAAQGPLSSALVDDKRVRPGPHAAPSWRTSTKRPVAADSLAASEV